MSLGRGLDSLFLPRAIAVVGASDDLTKLGGRALKVLGDHGFAGTVYPVSPKGGSIQGLDAYASVLDTPTVPDLAVIAVNAGLVPDVVEECARKGVGVAVVLSAGFGELGEEGRALQERIRAITLRSPIRVLGPNCLGAVSVAGRALATFSIVLDGGLPPAGVVGIASQSGNLGSNLLMLARERGLGVSHMVTTGNECDVDIAEAIAWLAKDDATRVILCCIETCRSGPRLLEALDAAQAAGKPTLVLKIGTSEIGQAVAASHTGALASADAVFDAVFRRKGAVRVRSIEDLLNAGHAASVALASGLPRRKRLGVITTSGGFGVMIADAASALGIELPPISEEGRRRILAHVPMASPINPVDATAQMSSRPELLSGVLSAVMGEEAVDAAMMLVTSSLHIPRLRGVYMEALRGVRAEFPHKLLMLVVRGPADAVEELNAMGIATVDGVDAACRTMAALAELGGNAPMPAPAPDASLLPSLSDEAFAGEAGGLAALRQAGVQVLPHRVVRSAEEAAAAAEALGWPVVLKVSSPDIAHKSDVGGVVVGIGDASELARAYDRMMRSVASHVPDAAIDGALVTVMAPEGVELILGAKRDPVFGPVVLVGFGGIFAELIQDTQVRLAPVSEDEAREMLRSLKAYRLLDGARGRAPADVAAAARAIAAVSQFAAVHADRVAEIDVNPLRVLEQGKGAVALDALLVPASRQRA